MSEVVPTAVPMPRAILPRRVPVSTPVEIFAPELTPGQPLPSIAKHYSVKEVNETVVTAGAVESRSLKVDKIGVSIERLPSRHGLTE